MSRNPSIKAVQFGLLSELFELAISISQLKDRFSISGYKLCWNTLWITIFKAWLIAGGLLAFTNQLVIYRFVIHCFVP